MKPLPHRYRVGLSGGATGYAAVSSEGLGNLASAPPAEFAYPIREILVRFARVRGGWSYYLPLAITISTSADYELIEWAAATVFGGDLGVAYLGTQGDVWDAQEDMALAALGALLSMGLLAIANRQQRNA